MDMDISPNRTIIATLTTNNTNDTIEINMNIDTNSNRNQQNPNNNPTQSSNKRSTPSPEMSISKSHRGTSSVPRAGSDGTRTGSGGFSSLFDSMAMRGGTPSPNR
jgi:hypothetical protein